MKNFRRKLFLASSALALVMLFGCSSTEETSSETGGGENSDQECRDQCAAIPGQSEDECLAVCD
jgi:ABC-type phosphate/phosphonate transport system substrate-binding protein